jgi:hypothetical protein
MFCKPILPYLDTLLLGCDKADEYFSEMQVNMPIKFLETVQKQYEVLNKANKMRLLKE